MAKDYQYQNLTGSSSMYAGYVGSAPVFDAHRYAGLTSTFDLEKEYVGTGARAMEMLRQQSEKAMYSSNPDMFRGTALDEKQGMHEHIQELDERNHYLQRHLEKMARDFVTRGKELKRIKEDPSEALTLWLKERIKKSSGD